MPRSKRQQNVPMVRDVAGSVPAASEELWRRGTDEDGVEYVGTPHAAEIRKRLRIVDETGTVYGTISIDESGRFLFDKGIVSKEDVVAYGASGDDVQTVTEMVEAYLAEHGGVGGGGIEGIELVLNSTDYKLQAKVTNQDGDEITSNVVDFPIESVVVDGEFDATNKNIVLTLKNGGQVTFSVGDLVRGLASTGYVDSAVSGITKASLGLGNVDNTSDANKNVASAVCLVDNGNSSNKVYLAYSGTGYTAETASHLCATGMQNGKRVYRDITASEAKKFIDLGNVNNTSDADKPISTATQTALNGKLSLGGGTMTGGFAFQKTESNTAYIYDVVNGNGVITAPLWKSSSVNNACSIRNALAFKWYNDIYQIGAIRGASTNCDGWGVTKGNNDLLFQINPYGSGFFKGAVVALSIIKSLNNTNGRWSVIDGGDIKLGAPSSGGWAQQLSVRNNDDTSTISAIAGAYGSGTTLNWNYYGGSYDDPWLKLTSASAVFKGDVTAYSDARLKSDIKELEYRGPLEPKEYIKDGKKCIGFIAQEVRKKYPELVIGEEKEDEYLSLNYGAITAVLAAENKELRKRIERLEMLINKLMEE